MMIVSKKFHQNLSNYIQFLFKKRFEFNKTMDYFWRKKLKIQIISSMIMLIRSSEMIFNPSRYSGFWSFSG